MSKTTQRIVTFAFLFMVIASAISLVEPTLNYVEFYRAIETLDLTKVNLDCLIEKDEVVITLSFTIANPTRYHGLKLKFLSYLLAFKTDGEIVGLTGGQTWYSNPLPIAPHAGLAFNYSKRLSIEKEPVKHLINLSEGDINKVKWVLRCTVRLLTFTGTLLIRLSRSW